MDASKAKKLTSGSGIRVGNAGVSWSPDGSTIVYTSRADGAATIWSMDVDGGRQRQLTNSTRDEGSPCVTPDGRSILFCSARSGTSNVWKMDLDGSNPVRLTTTEDYAVRCTPDGKWAVYGGYGAGYSSAWKKRIDGGDPIQLTATPVYSPSPSPDGKFVACLTIIEPGVPQQLLILPIDGGAPVKSFKTPQNIGLELRWSPDGREIYYNDTRADVSNLWAQPLDGTPARQVTHFTADRIYTFALSRDGRGIICSRGSSSSDVVLITGFR